MPEDYVLRNRAAWDGFATDFVESGHKDWSKDEPDWGIWGVPNTEVGMLSDVDGLDAVELGCGTGYVSAWLARRGARPVGIDNSAVQLATARRFQDEFDLRFPLIHGDAEHTPFPDQSLTSPSPSTGPPSGATPTCGSPRRRESFDRAAGSSTVVGNK